MSVALYVSRLENLLLSRKGEVAAEPLTVKRMKARNLYLKGKYFYKLEEYAKAASFFKRAYQADPKYEEARLNWRRVKLLIQ